MLAGFLLQRFWIVGSLLVVALSYKEGEFSPLLNFFRFCTLRLWSI